MNALKLFNVIRRKFFYLLCVLIFPIFLPFVCNGASDEPVEGIEMYIKKNPNKLKVKVFYNNVFIKETFPNMKGEFYVTLSEINSKIVRFRPGSELSEPIKFSFNIIVPPDFPYTADNTNLNVVLPVKKGTIVTEKTKFIFKLSFKPIQAHTNKGAFIINPKMDSG